MTSGSCRKIRACGGTRERGVLPAGPWPRVACGVSGDRLHLSSPLRPPGVGGAWAESYISTALWLSPSKSKEASKDQGNRPPMQRADDGDSGCDPGEGRTGVPRGGARTAEAAAGRSDFLLKLAAVVN